MLLRWNADQLSSYVWICCDEYASDMKSKVIAKRVIWLLKSLLGLSDCNFGLHNIKSIRSCKKIRRVFFASERDQLISIV